MCFPRAGSAVKLHDPCGLLKYTSRIQNFTVCPNGCNRFCICNFSAFSLMLMTFGFTWEIDSNSRLYPVGFYHDRLPYTVSFRAQNSLLNRTIILGQRIDELAIRVELF